MSKAAKLSLSISCFLPLFFIFWAENLCAAYCSFATVENENLFQTLFSQSECFRFNACMSFVWFAFFLIGIIGIICFCKSFLKARKLSKETIILTKAENITADYYFTYFSLFVISFFGVDPTKLKDVLILSVLMVLIIWVYMANEMYFVKKVVEAYIRPLKIKDSVPKYRVPIQSVLRSWAEDDALLLAMANAALQDKRGDTVENCRSDLLRKIFWIDERYDNIEHDYLDEIDAQVRRYTRAATQKVENLTNRDQNVRGNLNVLLTALSRNRRAGDLVDRIQPVFQLYEQSFLSEKSLWYRKRPEKRTKAATVLIQETASDADAAAQAAQLLRSEYGRAAIAAYVQGWLGDADVRYSKDLNIKDDKSYIMSLLAVLTSGDSAAGHQIKELGGSFHENGYSIPQMQIRRKEKKNGF